jgi:hypothetical protein
VSEDTGPTAHRQPRREPADSPGRDTDHPPAGSGPETYDAYQGASTGASASAEAASDVPTGDTAAEPTESGSGVTDEGAPETEPPDEHRVDVDDDDGGFIFG